MQRLEVSHLRPGVVLFARVPTFPWWPAIVARCPSTSTWTDTAQRAWVFFFNDTTGAWLNIRDVRPFTSLARTALIQYNTANPRFKKYLPKIQRAIALAEEYMLSPVLPRPLSAYCINLTYQGLDMEQPSVLQLPANVISREGNIDDPGGRAEAKNPGNHSTTREPSGDAYSKRKRDASSSHPGRASEWNYQDAAARSHADGDKYSRRKRLKLSKFSIVHDRDAEYSAAEQSIGLEGETGKRPARPTLLTLPLTREQSSANILQWKAQGSMSARVGAGSEVANGAVVGETDSAMARGDFPREGAASSKGVSRGDAHSPRGVPACDASSERAVAREYTSAARGEVYNLMQNRLSSMEGHLQAMQLRAGRGNDERAQPDPLIVLKESVQTLTAAAKEYARSRQFEPGSIEAGVCALWPEPAEGEVEDPGTARSRECARTVARAFLRSVLQGSEKNE